jgi:hypothetical protein
MHNSRLIQILSAFSKEELVSFRRFLDSPFVKTRRNVVSLFELLRVHYPEFISPGIEKSRVFSALFPRLEFSEKKLANISSDLTKEAENFLKHLALDADELESLIFTSKGFYQKKLLTHSKRVLNSVESRLKPGFSQSKDYFAKLRQVNFLKSAFYTENSEFDQLIECKKKHFESSAVQFIFDYIQIMSSMDAASSTYGKELESEFIKAVFESFDIDKLFAATMNSSFEHKDLIELLYYFMKTIKEPEKKNHYFKLKDTFNSNLDLFDREEKYFIFSHLINYCTDELTRKNEKFYAEGLNVYKAMLENQAYSYSDSEFMQVITYRNIIYYCNTMKDEKWFCYFIENFTDALSPEYRDDMRNFAYANLHFLTGEFEESLKSVSKIVNEFFLFKADHKNLQLKLFYELGYIEQAYSMVDSYKHFLSSNEEISPSYKIYYRNFLDKYLELLKLKTGKGREVAGLKRAEIRKETKIVNKKWLLEKIEEFC